MKKIFLAIIMATLQFMALSQTDLGLWTHISLEKKITDKFELNFEEEFRFDKNVSHLNRFLSEVSGKYAFNDYYALSLDYRFSIFTNEGFGNRLSLGNQLSFEKKDFTFKYKLNLQADLSLQEPLEYKIRNKFGIDYKINKKWSVGASGELFYSFYYYDNLLDRYRVSAGFDYSPKKRHRISPTLIYQNQINVAEPEADFIFSLGYKFKFK
jgi:hypothetical protein